MKVRYTVSVDVDAPKIDSEEDPGDIVRDEI